MATEKRMIDANALMAYIHNHDYELVSRMGCVDKGMFTDGIEHGINIQPTVDAVEVVHGRWECTYDAELGETDVTCSHCKGTRTINGCYVTSNGESCYFEDNYCPNCGAKMDGDGNA